MSFYREEGPGSCSTRIASQCQINGQLSVNSRHRNHEVWSHREEGQGNCSTGIASQCPENNLWMRGRKINKRHT